MLEREIYAAFLLDGKHCLDGNNRSASNHIINIRSVIGSLSLYGMGNTEHTKNRFFQSTRHLKRHSGLLFGDPECLFSAFMLYWISVMNLHVMSGRSVWRKGSHAAENGTERSAPRRHSGRTGHWRPVWSMVYSPVRIIWEMGMKVYPS